MAPLLPLQNLFRVCLLVTVVCNGTLAIICAIWVYEHTRSLRVSHEVHERGQSRRAESKRIGARRHGESSPSNCATARPSIGATATDAARTATELGAGPLFPQIYRRQAKNKQPESAPRSLAAPRQIAPKPPFAPRPGGNVDYNKSTAARDVSALPSETSRVVPSSSRQARQRTAVTVIPPTAGRRRGVPDGNDASSSARRQLSVSSASRFYAQVVNRQVALCRTTSIRRSLPTLAEEFLDPPAVRRSKSMEAVCEEQARGTTVTAGTGRCLPRTQDTS
jgi:hypothetical protein